MHPTSPAHGGPADADVHPAQLRSGQFGHAAQDLGFGGDGTLPDGTAEAGDAAGIPENQR